MCSWSRLTVIKPNVCLCVWLGWAAFFRSSTCWGEIYSRCCSTRALFHWIWTRPALLSIAIENVFERCSSCVQAVHYWFDPVIRILVTLSSGTPYLSLLWRKQYYEQLCLPTLTYYDYNVLNQSYTNYSDARSAELPQDVGLEQGLASFRFHWFGFSNCWYWNFNFYTFSAPCRQQSFVYLVLFVQLSP